MYNITSLKEWGKKDAGVTVENGVWHRNHKAKDKKGAVHKS